MRERRNGPELRERTGRLNARPDGGLPREGQTSVGGLTPYVPRIVPEWVGHAPEANHRVIPGTLVFTDLTGFTAMSERLSARGKIGAEELTDHLDATFTELLDVSGALGGSLLKFGGDALLLFFTGEGHDARAARAAMDMQETLARVGRIETSVGEIRLEMTVGAHRGAFDFFLVGDDHRELFVCGRDATTTARIEAAAGPGEVCLTPELADVLDPSLLEERSGVPVLTSAPPVEGGLLSIPSWPSGTSPDPFVPSMVRDQLAAGIELTEHRQMVVAFLHLSNVDELLELVGPQRAAVWMQEFVARTQRVFGEHGVAFVSSDVYEGGPKIICTTGALRTYENDEERMLRALRAVLDQAGPIELRVGVHRGHGFCGYIGPWFRRTFAIMGDVVNTAARVMSKAGPGELLCTDGVLERSDTMFASTPLPPFEAKGKAEPLVAHRVGEMRGTRTAGADHTLPLVGRGEELRALEEAVDAVRGGVGTFVEVTGEAGMGKSRLVEELLSGIDDLPTAEERCGRYAATTPYFPFRALLGELVGGASVEALVGCIRRHAPHLESVVPLLALPLGLSVDPTPETRSLSSSQSRARLHEGVIELVRAALSGPAVWVVEDGHWMDAASAELLRHLVSEIRELPLLLLVTRRPEGEELGPSETHLPLGPLEPEAAHVLLQEAATTHLMPKELNYLAERSRGNAHFLLELAAAVSSDRDLDRLPDSLEGLLASRVDALPPAERLVLRQLAVLGNRFDRWIAEDVIGPATLADVGPGLDAFVDQRRNEWRFRQTLVRDTAYEGLSYRERRDVHARAGAAIESRVSDPEPLGELLSLHFHYAGDHPKALRYSTEAAERAKGSYAFREAAIFLDRCVEAARALGADTELADALTGLGHVRFALSDYPASRTHHEEALEIKQAMGNIQGVAGSLNGLGLVARQQGNYETAQARFEESLAALQRLPEPDLQDVTACLSNISMVAFLRGAYADARASQEEVLARRRTIGDRAGAAGCLDMLGNIAFVTGRLDEAHHRYEESLATRRELRDLPGVAASLNNLGNVAGMLGQLSEARARYEESLEIRDELGDRHGVVSILNNLGFVAHHGGDYEAASRRYEEGLALARELGDRRGVAGFLHNLGDVALVRGDLEGALRLCSEALAERREIGDRSGEAETLTVLGTAAAAAADLKAARGYTREALEVLRELGNPHGVAECLETVAVIALEGGDARSAALLLGAADGFRAEAVRNRWSDDRYRASVDRARAFLGDRRFEETVARGGALDLEEACTEALAVLVPG